MSKKSKSSSVFNLQITQESANVLRALNNSVRVKIIDQLKGNPQTVTEIYTTMGIEQSVASQHLAILRKQQIVTTRREGKFIYYELNEERISKIIQLCEELIPA